MTEEQAVALVESVTRREGTHSVEDVIAACVEGRAQWWEYGGSIAVTEVLVYPRMKVCRGWLAAGDFNEILEIEKNVIAWAKSQGCARLEITGRKGWARRLLGHGYRETNVTMVKELEP